MIPRAHVSDLVKKYNAYLIKEQDKILNEFFGFEGCEKVYRYTHLVNGVALSLTDDEAERLAEHPRVERVQKSYRVYPSTVHTPDYLNLHKGVWSQFGGPVGAGENMIIGIVDTGIDPTHPSFTTRGRSSTVPFASTEADAMWRRNFLAALAMERSSELASSMQL